MSERWRPLEISDCDPSPFIQFHRWFDEAKGEMAERDAIALSTSTPEGRASSRMVLLRHVDDHSFGWFTNYESRKGVELRENPFASILWYCEPLGRQIRIEGSVERMTAKESDAYFATRGRGSQLGAHASHQSSSIPSRDVLEERVRAFDVEFASRDVPRPSGADYVSRPFASSFGNTEKTVCTIESSISATVRRGRWSVSLPDPPTRVPWRHDWLEG